MITRFQIFMQLKGNVEETTNFWISYMIGLILGQRLDEQTAVGISLALARKIPLNYRVMSTSAPDGRTVWEEKRVCCQELFNIPDSNGQLLVGDRMQEVIVTENDVVIGEVICSIVVADESHLHDPATVTLPLPVSSYFRSLAAHAWAAGVAHFVHDLPENAITDEDVASLFRDFNI